MIKNPALIPHKNYLLTHHFSPHLVHAHSGQWCYTSDLSELYCIWHPIANKLYSLNCWCYSLVYKNSFSQL